MFLQVVAGKIGEVELISLELIKIKITNQVTLSVTVFPSVIIYVFYFI
jgi:hypothetical protein